MGNMEIFNFQKYIMVLIAVAASLPAGAVACNIADVQTCPNSEHTRLPVWVFQPPPEMAAKCSTLKMALSCALKPEIIDGCNARDTGLLKAYKAFNDAVCDTYNYAYVKGVPCFTQTRIQNEVEICISAFKRVRRPCRAGAIKKARSCVREAVTGSACTSEDRNLLGILIDLYMRPINDMLPGCEWDDMETGPVATPTTQPVETTVFTTVTSTMTEPITTPSTTYSSQSGDTEKIGRVKGASSRVTPQTILTLGLALLVAIFLASKFSCTHV